MKNAKKYLCVILCLVTLFSVSQPFAAFAEDAETEPETTQAAEPETEPKKPKKKVKKVKTKVKGIKYKYNVKQSAQVTMDIKVTPAKPSRVVLLQRYNSKKKKYVTKKKYRTKSKKTASLKVSVPKKFRNKTLTKWRIVVESNDKAFRYVSKPIKVYTSNLKHLELSSTSACVYCIDTNTVLYDKNKDMRLKPASCTKIMTLIVAVESGRLGGTTTVTNAAVRVPAERLHARVGDRYRNRDLAFAMILGSANDASVMLANGTTGSVSNCVYRMNKVAKKIGLKNTHFTNVYGIPDPKHYTSSYDLCKMSAYGSDYSKYREVVGREMYGFRSLKYGKRYACYTADHMIRDKLKGQVGGKTGFSEVLGASYSGIYRYKGKTYTITIMHAASKAIRWKDLKKLYKYTRKYANSH